MAIWVKLGLNLDKFGQIKALKQNLFKLGKTLLNMIIQVKFG